MKFTFVFLSSFFILLSCTDQHASKKSNTVDWQSRQATINVTDTLISGSTFLSLYSQIYIRRDQEQTDLTATVSLHNPNTQDTLYVDKTVYYNTQGNPIRTYFDSPIYIRPMETVQIIIDDYDNTGGTGANFMFDWRINPNTSEPLFEAVMISTYGQQGISFVTQGKRVK